MFDFGSIADVSVSQGTFLKPWHIYDDVKFAGISDPITGTTKDGNTWKAWDFTFESPEGVFKEKIFEPNEKSTQRAHVKGNNGGEVELPSDFERIEQVIAQIVATYTTDGMDKLKKLSESGKLDNLEFSQFIEVIKKLLKTPINPTEEHPIQLKLQGRTVNGVTYARLPNAAVSKQNKEVFMGKFLGYPLSFTSYEKGQADKYNAGPTNMASVDASNKSIDISNVNTDDLLNDL